MKNRIRALLRAGPFQPFAIHMADEKSYRVEHPDLILASPVEGTQLGVETPDGGIHFLSGLLIASVERLPIPQSA